MRRSLWLFVAILGVPALAGAQQIPPPTDPVPFCGTQASPAADSYTVSVDGGAAQPLTMDATPNAGCAAGETSFTLPASFFTVGSHTVAVTARNTFGSTPGPAYTVTVGIAPGAFTITRVIPPGE